MKTKILFILDETLEHKRPKEKLNEIVKLIKMSFDQDSYDITIQTVNYDITDVLDIQLDTDDTASDAEIDGYNYIITEGTSSYFWLQTMCNIPMICINPVTDLCEEYHWYLDDEVSEYIKNMLSFRKFNTSNVLCVLSSAKHKYVKNYDNVFYDTTVIDTMKELQSEEFWNICAKLLPIITEVF